MVHATAGIGDSGANVIQFQVGQFVDNLQWGKARFEKVENIRDSNAHAADTGATAALARIESDSVEQVHEGSLSLRRD
jgi:hypothetical protein